MKGLFEVGSQIWPHVNRCGARGQNALESSTISQTLRFSTITFDLFVLQQRIWHHRVSLAEANQVLPNFAENFNVKIWPPDQFGMTGQIRSKSVILGIIRFGATRQQSNYCRYLYTESNFTLQCAALNHGTPCYTGTGGWMSTCTCNSTATMQ